jgi:hypothetical protein
VQWRKRIGWLRWSYDTDFHNRPSVTLDVEHKFPHWVGVSWGNKYSSPLWLVEFEIPDTAFERAEVFWWTRIAGPALVAFLHATEPIARRLTRVRP